MNLSSRLSWDFSPLRCVPRKHTPFCPLLPSLFRAGPISAWIIPQEKFSSIKIHWELASSLERHIGKKAKKAGLSSPLLDAIKRWIKEIDRFL